MAEAAVTGEKRPLIKEVTQADFMAEVRNRSLLDDGDDSKVSALEGDILPAPSLSTAAEQTRARLWNIKLRLAVKCQW
jgi:hypothetical protein